MIRETPIGPSTIEATTSCILPLFPLSHPPAEEKMSSCLFPQMTHIEEEIIPELPSPSLLPTAVVYDVLEEEIQAKTAKIQRFKPENIMVADHEGLHQVLQTPINNLIITQTKPNFNKKIDNFLQSPIFQGNQGSTQKAPQNPINSHFPKITQKSAKVPKSNPQNSILPIIAPRKCSVLKKHSAFSTAPQIQSRPIPNFSQDCPMFLLQIPAPALADPQEARLDQTSKRNVAQSHQSVKQFNQNKYKSRKKTKKAQQVDQLNQNDQIESKKPLKGRKIKKDRETQKSLNVQPIPKRSREDSMKLQKKYLKMNLKDKKFVSTLIPTEQDKIGVTTRLKKGLPQSHPGPQNLSASIPKPLMEVGQPSQLMLSEGISAISMKKEEEEDMAEQNIESQAVSSFSQNMDLSEQMIMPEPEAPPSVISQPPPKNLSPDDPNDYEICKNLIRAVVNMRLDFEQAKAMVSLMKELRKRPLAKNHQKRKRKNHHYRIKSRKSQEDWTLEPQKERKSKFQTRKDDD